MKNLVEEKGKGGEGGRGEAINPLQNTHTHRHTWICTCINVSSENNNKMNNCKDCGRKIIWAEERTNKILTSSGLNKNSNSSKQFDLR